MSVTLTTRIPEDLADAIEAVPETVGTNLNRLKSRGLVRHQAPYWAFTDDRAHAAPCCGSLR